MGCDGAARGHRQIAAAVSGKNPVRKGARGGDIASRVHRRRAAVAGVNNPGRVEPRRDDVADRGDRHRAGAIAVGVNPLRAIACGRDGAGRSHCHRAGARGRANAINPPSVVAGRRDVPGRSHRHGASARGHTGNAVRVVARRADAEVTGVAGDGDVAGGGEADTARAAAGRDGRGEVVDVERGDRGHRKIGAAGDPGGLIAAAGRDRAIDHT